MKNFDFDNDSSEKTIFTSGICYIENERSQAEVKFHSKNYLLEMTRSHTEMPLKSAPQNLNFVMARAISKIYKLDCCYTALARELARS